MITLGSPKIVIVAVQRLVLIYPIETKGLKSERKMDKNYDVVVKIYRQLDVSRRERNCAIVLYFYQTPSSEVLWNIIMESIVKDNTENKPIKL